MNSVDQSVNNFADTAVKLAIQRDELRKLVKRAIALNNNCVNVDEVVEIFQFKF